MVNKEYRNVHNEEPFDNNKISKFPGNINGLIISLDEYCKVLEKS